MNKDLRTGLILVGVVAAILLLAFAAQAAGLTQANWANMPYGGQMGAAGAMQRMGGVGMLSMMGSVGGALQNGGHMMDFDQMPHMNQAGDGQPYNCPYDQEQ